MHRIGAGQDLDPRPAWRRGGDFMGQALQSQHPLQNLGFAGVAGCAGSGDAGGFRQREGHPMRKSLARNGETRDAKGGGTVFTKPAPEDAAKKTSEVLGEIVWLDKPIPRWRPLHRNQAAKFKNRMRQKVFSALTSILVKFSTVLAFAAISPVLGPNAYAMTPREMLHLNQFGGRIYGLSWCNEDTLIGLRDFSSNDAQVNSSKEDSKRTIVNLISLFPHKMSSLVTYQNANISVGCLRNGEYVYVSGRVNAAAIVGGNGTIQIPFAHLVDITPKALLRKSPSTQSLLLTKSFFRDIPFTAADGSIYGEVMNSEIDFQILEKAEKSAILKNNTSYSLRRGDIGITFVATAPGIHGIGHFPIYGMWANEIWALGSYVCRISRPGCGAGAPEHNVAYYIYSKYNIDSARVDALFTISPEQNALLKRWPIVAKPGVAWHSLVINGVTLDEGRCYVLLEPNPTMAENRINGRLRLDLYIANCKFTNDTLEFDQPHVVGRKRGSFYREKIGIHGDFAVITETLDLAAQQEDQVEAERDALAQPKICARFYRSDGGAELSPASTICASLGPEEAKSLLVSPGGGYVAVESDADSLIVGRDYRNYGTGPHWLTDGDRP